MNRVKQYRLSAGLTQDELARLSGLNRNTISYIEKNNSKLQKLTANCLASALKVPAAVLSGERDEGYLWNSGETHWPPSEGLYLVGYKLERRKGFFFSVFLWKDDAWWIVSLNGDPMMQVALKDPWWSEINKPPI